MEKLKGKEDAQNLIGIAMLTDTMLRIIDEHRNDENITLKEIRNKWTTEHNIKAEKWPFINVYQYLITLLARIVLAQAFYDEMSKIKISELPDEWVIKNIDIIDEKIKKEDYTLNQFIRKLRNSISHGNVEIGLDDDSTFHFKDRKDANSPFNFECSLTYNELRSFVDNFTKWVTAQPYINFI